MMQQIHIQRLQRELNPNFLFDLQKKLIQTKSVVVIE